MSVGLLWKMPQRETERERREGQKEETKKGTQGSQTFQQIYQVRVNLWAKKCDSAVWVPGFPTYDCAFLCQERSLYRKLNHVSGQAHVVGSTSAGLGRKQTESLS
ncbi:hypothetical protein E3U43_007288 [Larimichthys crocea]|uniref:Uncharacterized protein n=1 Tax=Larimichthys crocea TaxID=215358 RepID=A0ACD3RN33_LARCR|nr:hypothetical protein E3U43_007288 [Larimichthys crocea]